MEVVTGDLYQQLKGLEVAAIDSHEMMANNLSTQLTGVAESCTRVSDGFGEAVRAQTQLHSEQLEVYQQAVVNNMTKLIHAEVEKRSEEANEMITTALENITTHLTEIEDKTEDIGREILTHDLIFCEKFTENLSNVTQSQQQLFIEVGKEIERKMNESFISSMQSHAELVGHIADKSNEIQVDLTRVQDEVRTCNERQLLGRNMTVMLAEIQSTCASAASTVNTTEDLLTSGFREQRRLVSANAQLLGAVNQTCATAAEQSLQPLNNAISNVSAQLVTIHDIVQFGK